MATYLAVSVPKYSVKDVKNLLENLLLINRNFKIYPDPNDTARESIIIVTNRTHEQINDKSHHALYTFYSELETRGIPFKQARVDGTKWRERTKPGGQTGLQQAMRMSADALPAMLSVSTRRSGWMLELHRTPPPKLSYCIYYPMLLINRKGQEFSVFTSLCDLLKCAGGSESWHLFFGGLCQRMGITHVAVNSPIPAKAPETEVFDSSDGRGRDGENVLRTPSNLEPIYGDFGPGLPSFPKHRPASSDFTKAFWVSTRQNQIFQTWAPRYTMFSQGNISEKTRLLHLPAVRDAVIEGRRSSRGCAAVDLCAGIGYFAFSYAKAGMDKIFCWDLNPWSIEGLRRGSFLNGWQCTVVEPAQGTGQGGGGGLERDTALPSALKLLAFQESNIHSVQRLDRLRKLNRACVPPIRHVNAGMLPTTAMAWRAAVELVDEGLGGWIHLHESVLEGDLQKRVTDTLHAVENVWRDLAFTNGKTLDFAPGDCLGVRLEHLETVKSMGPKFLHVVLDIWIPPKVADKND